MTTTLCHRPGCLQAHAICRVTGELDMDTAPTMRATTLAFLVTHGPYLSLDLSGLTFMDCAGLSALVVVVREAAARGGHANLIWVPAGPERLLRVAGLAGWIDHDPQLALPHPVPHQPHQPHQPHGLPQRA